MRRKPVTNYIKLLVPTADRSMYILRMWFLNGDNVEKALYEAQFALADARNHYSGTEWKTRPRLVAYEPIVGWPGQVTEFVGEGA